MHDAISKIFFEEMTQMAMLPAVAAFLKSECVFAQLKLPFRTADMKTFLAFKFTFSKRSKNILHKTVSSQRRATDSAQWSGKSGHILLKGKRTGIKFKISRETNCSQHYSFCKRGEKAEIPFFLPSLLCNNKRKNNSNCLKKLLKATTSVALGWKKIKIPLQSEVE